MKGKLQFKVSSATKSILGRDLIIDKNIAIFELVKNSYDALAKSVKIHIDDDQIKIVDDGVGMTAEDLKDKWMFIGYSEKIGVQRLGKNGQKRRNFAGAKGIGRLACDRLGRELKIISIKNGKCEQLTVRWGDFEVDSTIELSKVDVYIETLPNNPYPDLKHGTVLEIKSLREEWSEEDVSKLNQHLTKLISPVEGDSDEFKIFINYKNKKREEVKNFIFDKLGLKTTSIKSSVSADGKLITTELIDRGERIYKIVENNKWSNRISDVNINLFYLSRPTKISFFHLMKMDTVNFGSVFIYKNGFRVFPYGEQGDDSLRLDQRKTQGYARYLGTRDLLGNILIQGTDDEFKETSSRDGGLINSKGFIELKLYFEEVLKRLEAYTVGTLNWTYDKDTEKEFYPSEKKAEIKDLVTKLTKTKNFVSLDYDYSTVSARVNEKVSKGYEGATGVLKREAEKSGDISLVRAVKKIEEKQKIQAKQLKEQQVVIEKKEDQVSALKSFTNKNLKNLQSYHHQILISVKILDTYISNSFKAIKQEKYEKLDKYLLNIKKENDKIKTIARFATGSGMDELATKKERSLNKFAYRYLLEDYIPVASDGLNISVTDSLKEDYMFSFRPFDLSIIFDNLIDNAKKAGARNCTISFMGDSKTLEVFISDDGKGLDSKFKNDIDSIFELKTSSTDGAGIGLFSVKELVENVFGGTVTVQPNRGGKGLKFIMTFAK